VIRRTIALIAILGLSAACSTTGADYTPPPPPSMEAAREYLTQLVTLVSHNGAGAACSMGASTCAQSLQRSDPAAVPRTAPRIVGTRVLLAKQTSGGGWEAAGRVLMLCGRDGIDRPYYSELLVFQDGDRLIAADPLYWTGTTVATNPISGRTPDSPCD
jgi:hypothetical protein